ncbi:MAG: type I pullulanase [Clostridia bacterium]|nr:type I pullulanase [Clostridia bacterium]
MKKHKFISSIICFLFAFTSILFSFPGLQSVAKVPSKVKLTIHYRRLDNNYTDWNLWIWPDGGDGNSYEFTGEDDYGKIATVELTDIPETGKIGFIVREGDWKNKDVDKDRFITDIPDDGVVEIWLLQGEEKIYMAKEDVELGGKIKTAYIDDFNLINVTLNTPAELTGKDNEGFSVKAGDKDIPIKEVTSTDNKEDLSSKFKITLAEELDLGDTVTVYKEDYTEKLAISGKIMGSKKFNEMFYYSGDDLGNVYSKDKTKFRVWAPLASEVKLLTYAKAEDNDPKEEINMTKAEKGTWTAEISGDQDGLIYTYKVNNGGEWTEAVDPYARAVTINGNKGVVVDLDSTDPEGWKGNKKPKQKDIMDTIIYELHVRDFSSFKDSGMTNPRTFLAFLPKDTKGPNGASTGLSYLKELGITHVQLLPIYDYATVDETNPTAAYNWGYDPKNYNAVEGSYSTDPADPKARIRELKQAIQAMHDEDLRVIMDVVYNHMYDANTSNFNNIVPGYYFRKNASGGWANESGCGNTIATENAMARKFVIDSVKYWATEYNLDGFRFDLMGLMDVTTMNEVRTALDQIDKSIFIHGEGWNMGTTLTDEEKAIQRNAKVLKGIGFFNDTIRDGIKGSVFNQSEAGWINGNYSRKTDVIKGIVGAIKYNDKISTWGEGVEPYQSTNYSEAHDNNTLWDKLAFTNPDDSEEDRKKMHKMSSVIVLTSQGIPFIHAGQEFLRSKDGNPNSYNASEEINTLNWQTRADNDDMVEYHKGLIKLRKAHPAFKMPTAKMIKENLKFFEDTPDTLIAYQINNNANGDKWNDIVVAFNADTKPQTITLPKEGKWNIVVDGEKAGVETLKVIEGDTYEIPALSSVVMYSGTKSAANNPLIWALACVGLAVLVGAFIAVKKVKAKKN